VFCIPDWPDKWQMGRTINAGSEINAKLNLIFFRACGALLGIPISRNHVFWCFLVFLVSLLFMIFFPAQKRKS